MRLGHEAEDAHRRPRSVKAKRSHALASAILVLLIAGCPPSASKHLAVGTWKEVGPWNRPSFSDPLSVSIYPDGVCRLGSQRCTWETVDFQTIRIDYRTDSLAEFRVGVSPPEPGQKKDYFAYLSEDGEADGVGYLTGYYGSRRNFLRQNSAE